MMAAAAGADHKSSASSPAVPFLEETCDAVSAARLHWDTRLRYELCAVAQKLNRKLVEPRPVSLTAGLGSVTSISVSGSASGGSGGDEKIPRIRFVYTCEDLLETIAAIRNTNTNDSYARLAAAAPSTTAAASSAGSGACGGLIKLSLPPPLFRRIRKRFTELSTPHAYRHIGVDDTPLIAPAPPASAAAAGAANDTASATAAASAAAAATAASNFSSERLSSGARLLKRYATDPSVASLDLIRTFVRTGCPLSLRPAMWAVLLGLPLPAPPTAAPAPVPQASATVPPPASTTANSVSGSSGYFESLLSHVRRWDLITDDLIRFDVIETCHSAEYFVFEDSLTEVMLALSRDAAVANQTSLLTTAAPLKVTTDELKSNAKGGVASSSGGTSVDVPPSTIIPYHRHSMLVAPLCFLMRSAAELYPLARGWMTRYGLRLHILSTAPDSIITLSKLFEDLTHARVPKVVSHLVSLGVSPLCIAFPWLFTAFSGVLEVEQVLLLWDRVIGYDTLSVLAILAAAIFAFREPNVLRCTTAEHAIDSFRDLSTIRCIPLLQFFLLSP